MYFTLDANRYGQEIATVTSKIGNFSIATCWNVPEIHNKYPLKQRITDHSALYAIKKFIDEYGTSRQKYIMSTLEDEQNNETSTE